MSVDGQVGEVGQGWLPCLQPGFGMQEDLVSLGAGGWVMISAPESSVRAL